MIAVTLIFEAIGYYWIYKPGVFLVVFILTYLAFTIVFMNAMLFQGDREWKKKLEAIKFNKEGVQVYFVVTLITNISLAIFILVQSFATSSIVSNYLLIIFMLNMILYIFYYVVMKNYHVYSYHRKWESLSFTCYFYLFLSALSSLCSHLESCSDWSCCCRNRDASRRCSSSKQMSLPLTDSSCVVSTD